MIIAAVSVLQCSMSLTDQNPVHDAVSGPEETQLENPLNRLVGITEAASMTGRNKGRISLDTNGGKLPFTKNEEGHKRYKVFDLYQLYGLQNPKPTSSRDAQKPTEGATETALETAVQLARMEERVKALENENRSLREDKRQLWETTQQLTGRLLAAPTPAPQPAAAIMPAEQQAPPAPKSLWQRIIGT